MKQIIQFWLILVGTSTFYIASALHNNENHSLLQKKTSI